ncbi:expressed unknown protein [Seminavis robusta]|uniref:Uncharacterized protein n=1 Tax=Seminavis robusta TaxID=568900 RepID=A0A9N8DZJ4_9STRA|nr:expressed unknown protein [Seminavis robusta]|eukprot:Sro502_g155650.1 n/a (378) ;mRNA; f:52714-53847
MATTEERELLRANKHGPVLQLWLDKDSQHQHVASALRKNKTVTTVSVFVEEDFMESPLQDIAHLFRAIGCLPLQNLYIYSFGRNFDVFPIRLLIEVFSRAKKLEVLTMYFIELGGKKKHFDAFEAAIRGHPSLREFRLENCRLPDDYLNTHGLDQFVKTLGTLPKIEKIDLFATEMGYLGTLSKESMANLAGIKNLACLSLINFALGNDHITALSQALKGNTNLTELAISCDPKFCSALAPVIATNQTLNQVKVRMDSLDDDVFVQSIAGGLKDNKSITRFDLQGDVQNKLSVASQKIFADMLEKNSTLEYLEIPLTDQDSKMKAKYYLKLNQTGKRGLMENPGTSKKELVNALAYVGDDLDCLNHFLATKPTLVHD